MRVLDDLTNFFLYYKKFAIYFVNSEFEIEFFKIDWRIGLAKTEKSTCDFWERLRESCIMLRSLTQHTSNKQERKKNSKILSAVYKKSNLEEALESYTHGQVVAKDKATFCTKSSPLLIFDICFTFESKVEPESKKLTREQVWTLVFCTSDKYLFNHTCVLKGANMEEEI